MYNRKLKKLYNDFKFGLNFAYIRECGDIPWITFKIKSLNWGIYLTQSEIGYFIKPIISKFIESILLVTNLSE